MKIYAVCSKYIVFSLAADVEFSKDEAENLIRNLLEANSLPEWNSICIDIFTGSENSLYIAYPNPELIITLASYALPFLEEYFTE